jgi:hypothetical protein
MTSNASNASWKKKNKVLEIAHFGTLVAQPVGTKDIQSSIPR